MLLKCCSQLSVNNTSYFLHSSEYNPLQGHTKTAEQHIIQDSSEQPQPSHLTVKCYASLISLTFLKGNLYNNFSKQQRQKKKKDFVAHYEHCKADTYFLDLLLKRSFHLFLLFFSHVELHLPIQAWTLTDSWVLRIMLCFLPLLEREEKKKKNV